VTVTSESSENDVVVENRPKNKLAPSSNLYCVERILDKKVDKKGHTYYMIKWIGYDDPKDNSWTHVNKCHCPDLIVEFEKNEKTREEKKPIDNAKLKRDFEGDKDYVMKNVVIDENASTADNQDEEPNPSKFQGKIYGFQCGKRVEIIIGAKMHSSLGMIILYKYEDGTYESAPSSIFSDHEPDMLINFYEDRFI